MRCLCSSGAVLYCSKVCSIVSLLTTFSCRGTFTVESGRRGNCFCSTSDILCVLRDLPTPARWDLMTRTQRLKCGRNQIEVGRRKWLKIISSLFELLLTFLNPPQTLRSICQQLEGVNIQIEPFLMALCDVTCLKTVILFYFSGSSFTVWGLAAKCWCRYCCIIWVLDNMGCLTRNRSRTVTMRDISSFSLAQITTRLYAATH